MVAERTRVAEVADVFGFEEGVDIFRSEKGLLIREGGLGISASIVAGEHEWHRPWHR
jgi:hypothetical protein